MYRLDFGGAERVFTEMTQEAPKHPAGYVFLASLYWWQFSNDHDTLDKKLEEKFFAAARKGIELAKNRKAAGISSNEADFWLGGAHGVIGRWHVSQFEWIRAYLNGKKAYNLLRSVHEKDPENYDAALGTGEFEYLASRLPGLVRISALLFVKGDKEGGIRACVLAAEKGSFAATEAKLFLTAIYNENEKDFPEALKWADALVKEDPDNLFFRMLRGIVLFYKKDYAEADATLADATRQVESRPVGDPIRTIRSMGHYHLGLSSLLQQKYDDAAAHLSRAVEEKEYPARGWVTNSFLRRGQAHDLAGRRAQALADYETVLKRPNFWDSRKFARKHKDKPATMQDVLETVYGEQAVSYDRDAK